MGPIPFTYQWTTATDYLSTSTGTTVTIGGHNITSGTPVWNWSPATNAVWDDDSVTLKWIPDKLPAGQRTLELPDGAKIHIDDAGNYKIEDKDAKVTYQANRIREWSPHLNASDMLAQFVEYVRKLGVHQKDVLGLPLELFINWLVIEAAERDQDPIPLGVARVDRVLKNPKCISCGKFIPRLHYRNRFPFCNPNHGIVYMQKQRLLARPA